MSKPGRQDRDPGALIPGCSVDLAHRGLGGPPGGGSQEQDMWGCGLESSGTEPGRGWSLCVAAGLSVKGGSSDDKNGS